MITPTSAHHRQPEAMLDCNPHRPSSPTISVPRSGFPERGQLETERSNESAKGRAPAIPSPNQSPLLQSLRCLVAMLVLGANCPTGAATLTVTNLDDSGAGSLRQLILDAGPGDTIDFGVTGTIGLTSGQLVIDKDLMITGPGAKLLTLSAGGMSRVLHVASGTVRLAELSLIDGSAPPYATGGAIENHGILTVDQCSIVNNKVPESFSSTSRGGGIYSDGSLVVRRCTLAGNVAGDGGGIFNAGTLLLENSTLSTNQAASVNWGGVGGGLHNADRAQAQIDHCTITGNGARGAGGLGNMGTAVTTVRNTIVAGNYRTLFEGPDLSGVFVSQGYNLIGDSNDSVGFANAVNHDLVGASPAPLNPRLGPLLDNGGPTPTHELRPGSPAIDQGSSSGTSTDQRGAVRPFNSGSVPDADDGSDIGAFEWDGPPPPCQTLLLVTTLEDDGPGSLRQTLREAQRYNCIEFGVTGSIGLTSGQLVIDKDLTIAGPGANLLTVSAGGLSRVFQIGNSVVSLSGLRICDGAAPQYAAGGAIENHGILTVDQCFIANNNVPESFSSTSRGGGIYSDGSLVVRRSTLAGNIAGHGGGIFNAGTLLLENSTLSGNQAASVNWGGVGGGLHNASGAQAQVDHCTITGNGARGAGGLGNVGVAVMTVRNSIVAGNHHTLFGGPDLGGTFVSQGYNLIGDPSDGEGFTNAVNHDLVGVDPLLYPLLDNGGSTPTHALMLYSPAIDHGNADTVGSDQRGLPRLFNFPAYADAADGCDIGAFELQESAQPGPTYVVNTLEDSDDGIAGIAHCSLREAVAMAKASAERVAIHFEPGHAGIVTPLSGSITLTNGPLIISQGMEIAGSVNASIVIEGDGSSRLFEISASSTALVAISQLTLAGGQAGTANGGAILNEANLELDGCTLTQNEAASGGAVWSGPSATLLVKQCTFSGNRATFVGGAVACETGTIMLRHCTLNANTAGSGGGVCNQSGTVILRNTVIGGNTATSTGPDAAGIFQSDDFNLIADTSGGTLTGMTGHTITGHDPMLAPLADNGGPTWTQLPLAGSPLIDAGITDGLINDQRGVRRLADMPDAINVADGGDIGAAEYDVIQSGPGLVVNALDDVDDGLATIGHCSLREALLAANILPDANTIGFATNVTGTIDLTRSLPEIANPVTINGPGFARLTVRRSAGGEYRILSINNSVTANIAGLTLSGGFFDEIAGYGGGIQNMGTLDLQACVVLNNLGYCGAGIYNGGTLGVSDCIIWGNQCTHDGEGGGIYNGATASLTMANSLVHGNGAGNDLSNGGGIYNGGGTVEVSHSAITANSAMGDGAGGGVYNRVGGVVRLQDTTVDSNEAFAGGGLLNEGGSVTVARCTFSANAAPEDDGGGLWSNGTLLVSNSTVSGNSSDFWGGGIYAAGTVTIVSSTITANRAYDGGGIKGTATLCNSILAGNQTHTGAGLGPDCYGTIVSADFNLIQNLTDLTISGAVAHCLIGVDPELGPLADHGGPTLTHDLLPGSPAIDQGLGGSLTTDQRGFARPVDLASLTNAADGDGSDIGAFELASLDADGDGMADAWERAHGLNWNDPSDAALDPDGDGYTNQLEYALWLDPTSGLMAGLPQAGQAGGYLTLTYQTPTAESGITYEVQAAEDPAGPWSSTGVVQVASSAHGDYRTITVRDAEPMAGHLRRFMRIQVNFP
ncbi:MAG: CSLREA domain-containing protein [Verrucomicrobia bacterium]|nr:CSLREA domain-containing protein [Verrucomicrobiota bacterium]